MAITLTAPDHRPGAHGDQRTVAVDSHEAAHTLARELNAGIYTVTDGTVAAVYEWDGMGEPALIGIEASHLYTIHGDGSESVTLTDTALSTADARYVINAIMRERGEIKRAEYAGRDAADQHTFRVIDPADAVCNCTNPYCQV